MADWMSQMANAVDEHLGSIEHAGSDIEVHSRHT